MPDFRPFAGEREAVNAVAVCGQLVNSDEMDVMHATLARAFAKRATDSLVEVLCFQINPRPITVWPFESDLVIVHRTALKRRAGNAPRNCCNSLQASLASHPSCSQD